MSAVAPLLKPFGLGTPEQTTGRARAKSRPRLVIVAAPARRAGRVPFAILIGAILVSGLVTLLMLHTMAAQDGFKVSDLQAKQKVLSDQLQSLEQVVQADSAPGTLRQKAAALGMLPSEVNTYKHLKNGQVVGVETPIYPVVPVVTAPAQPTTAGAPAAGKAKTGRVTTATSPTTTGDQTTPQTTKATHHHGAATTGAATTGTATTGTATTGTSAPATTGTSDTTATNPHADHPGHPHR